MTHSLVEVATALLDDPKGKHWGYELSKKSGVRSGVLYPLLGRMLDDGWLEDGWEDPETMTAKRPPRRYYEITSTGLVELGAIMSQARRDSRFQSMKSRLAW